MNELEVDYASRVQPTPDLAFALDALQELAGFELAEKRDEEIEKLLIERIKHLFAMRRETLAQRRKGFEAYAWSALQQAASAMIPKGKKSVDLGVGSLGWRKTPQRVVLPDDETDLLAWCREHCRQAVRVVESVDRAAVRKYVTETGELPPGCSIEEPKNVFYAKPSPEASLPVIQFMLENTHGQLPS